LKSMHQTKMMNGPSEGSHKSCRDTEAARPTLDHWGWSPSTGKCTSQHRSHTYRLLCVRTSRSGMSEKAKRQNWSESWATVENTVCLPLLTCMTDQDHRTQTFTLVEEGTWSFTSTITSFEVSKPFKPQLTGQMRFRSIWNREFLPTNQWTNLT
jgi:hypothetical protein